MMINQVLSIWKDVGMTSYDVVDVVKKKTKEKKVGHCGTLDPFADGVILICTGDKTKEIDYFMDLDKKYIADIVLGYETDTLDKTGEVIYQSRILSLNEKKIIEVLNKFIGETYQIPPYFSALKFKGIPLYKYARKDIFIRKKARKVFIKDIKLINFQNNTIQIHVECGKGTYIRALARDIAYGLGTHGSLNQLSRISIGQYNKDNSIKVDDIKNV